MTICCGLLPVQERNASDKERLYLIEVLAPFTYFYCYQIPVVLSCFGMGSEVSTATLMQAHLISPLDRFDRFDGFDRLAAVNACASPLRPPPALLCGSQKIEAAALLFTRAADLEEGIMELTRTLTDRDLHELMAMLGWYAYLRWGNPTGKAQLTAHTLLHSHTIGILGASQASLIDAACVGAHPAHP